MPATGAARNTHSKPSSLSATMTTIKIAGWMFAILRSKRGATSAFASRCAAMYKPRVANPTSGDPVIIITSMGSAARYAPISGIN
jgi:hypothetical protein